MKFVPSDLHLKVRQFFAHGYEPQGWLCCVGFRSLAPTIACVASVSVWFRSKERPVLDAREMKREPKNERGERGRGIFSSPLPPRSFSCTIFWAVFDSRSSFFAPKPHGNAYYAGYPNLKITDVTTTSTSFSLAHNHEHNKDIRTRRMAYLTKLFYQLSSTQY